MTAAATGDIAILDDLAATDDADLRWIARQNVGKARVQRLITHE